MRYDSYRFFVIKNESANKIAVSHYIIFEKIELKVTKMSLLSTLGHLCCVENFQR